MGSAIAASLAAEGVASISLFDTNAASAEGLAARLRQHYPKLAVDVGSDDPAGYDLVVNGTPLGMKPADPLPFDVARLAPATFVGEVVMKQEITPLLQAARDQGCRYQVGTDMLFEMIPAYLEFFGFGTTTPDELRAVAQGRVLIAGNMIARLHMTDRYALFGQPLGHTKSPLIHAEFARQTGQDLTYEAIETPVGGFAAAVDRFRAAGGRGCNVTLPFKRRRVRLRDRPDGARPPRRRRQLHEVRGRSRRRRELRRPRSRQ